MLEIRKKRHGLSYSYIWFAEAPSLARALAPVVYMQCRHQGPAAGYSSDVFHTLLVDLAADPDTLLRTMSRTTSYKIKRARREGVAIRQVKSMQEFIAFYNGFASSKGRARLEIGDLFGWGHETLAFGAVSEGEPLVMNCYLVDRTVSRARLLFCGSHFRDLNNTKQRNAIGRANRFLHYEMMLHFKEAGIATYDMGGYAKNTTDAELAAINSFKAGFGGVVLREDHYVSLPMQVLQMAGRAKQRFARGRAAARAPSNLGASPAI